MPDLATDVATYRFSATDRLMLDSNVWLFVLGPRGPLDWGVKTYTRVFQRIIVSGCRPYVDQAVLGEFVGRYLRIKYDLLRESDPAVPNWYKPFRESRYFAPIAAGAAADAKRLLSLSVKTSVRFEAVDVFGLLDSFAQGRLDVGDLLILEICRTQGLTLVTDDADFKGLGIPILTANRKLLS